MLAEKKSQPFPSRLRKRRLAVPSGAFEFETLAVSLNRLRKNSFPSLERDLSG